MSADASDVMTIHRAAGALVRALPPEAARALQFCWFETDRVRFAIICSGDAHVDGRKLSDHFCAKARPLPPEEAMEMILARSNAESGLLALRPGVPVYLDESLLRFDAVLCPAAGGFFVELTIDELFKYSGARGWVDVCLVPEEGSCAHTA